MQHPALRAYASLHLAATYVLLVGHLPGLGHYLEPQAAREVLQVLGLWQPTVKRDVLPILALLLLVRPLSLLYRRREEGSGLCQVELAAGIAQGKGRGVARCKGVHVYGGR